VPFQLVFRKMTEFLEKSNKPASSEVSGSLFSICSHKKTERRFSPQKSPKTHHSDFSISFFPTGVKINGFKPEGSENSKNNLENREDQTIKTFSHKSRQRMREFLVSHEFEETLKPAGVTLTIPGPVLPLNYVKKLFNHFQTNFRRKGNSCVWRIETQRRGQLHWHLLAGLKSSESDLIEIWLNALHHLGNVEFDEYKPYSGKTGMELLPVQSTMLTSRQRCKSDFIITYSRFEDYREDKNNGLFFIRLAFFGGRKYLPFTKKSMKLLKPFMKSGFVEIKPGIWRKNDGQIISVKGSYEYKKIYDKWLKVFGVESILEKYPPNAIKGYSLADSHYSGVQILLEKDYSKVYGAEERAVDIEWQSESSDRSKYNRYLNDHATKSKQEQVAENIGKHWGIINRNKFKELDELKTFKFFDDTHFHDFLRVYQRLRTPMIRCDKVPNFGRKLSNWKPSKGFIGQRVFFGDIETVKKIFKWSVERVRERRKNLRSSGG